jgi:hypothetical protein
MRPFAGFEVRTPHQGRFSSKPTDINYFALIERENRGGDDVSGFRLKFDQSILTEFGEALSKDSGVIEFGLTGRTVAHP